MSQSTQRENGQSVYNALKRWENLLKEEEAKKTLTKEMDQAAKIVAVCFGNWDKQFQEDAKNQKPVARLLASRAITTKLQKLGDLSS